MKYYIYYPETEDSEILVQSEVKEDTFWCVLREAFRHVKGNYVGTLEDNFKIAKSALLTGATVTIVSTRFEIINPEAKPLNEKATPFNKALT